MIANENIRFRNASSNSEQSTNKNSTVNISLEEHSKALPAVQYSDTIDLYELFLAEREACNKYRLIVTLNPIMSNILCNAMTEIVLDDGCNAERVDGRVKAPTDRYDPDTNDRIEVFGDPNPDRIKMIENTEYTKSGLGYTYQCGLDIFNNHILRDVSFKSVNMLGQGQSNTRKLNFNTIRDLMRYADGSIVRYNKRINVTTSPQLDLEKHLYDHEDILSIDETINERLGEDNGWIGFTNGMNIRMKRFATAGVQFGEDPYKEELGINRVINSSDSCDFIDMYPDRSLFSFNPKTNPYRRRLEYNWKYCLTYPYKSTKNHDLVYGDGVNGLKCQYIVKRNGMNGTPVYLFRMLLPHNLSTEDRFYLYYNGTRIDSPLVVGGVGDLQQNDKKYVFYVNGDDIEEYLGLSEGEGSSTTMTTEELNEFNENLNNTFRFRIRKVVNDFESEYYLRIFRKLPNFRYAREEVTEENVNEIADGLVSSGYTEFTNALYPLGFASTIYNDKSSQVTFLDDVDVSYLRDNLNRPLHEIFFTVVKNNQGYKQWYGDDLLQPNVEASGCGEISVSSFDGNVPNEGGTVKVQVFATNNIGDSIQWTAYDMNGSQIGSGTDGDYLSITVPATTERSNENGIPAVTLTYTIRAEYNGSQCSDYTFNLTQEGIIPEEEECNDCKPYVHTDENYRNLDSNAQSIQYTIYSSCYKGTPIPWRVRLLDRNTGQSPTWARVSPSNGDGICCNTWDACGAYDQTAKDTCVDLSNTQFTITVDENLSSEPRSLDWIVETTGICQDSSSDYLLQNGSEAGDACPKKYVMFQDARTVTNFPNDGYYSDERLNFYCEVGDVEPYFTIEPNNVGVTVQMTGADTCRITIPANTSSTSRSITVTVHPNIDEAIVQANSLSLYSSARVINLNGDTLYNAGPQLDNNGNVYADYDEDEKAPVSTVLSSTVGTKEEGNESVESSNSKEVLSTENSSSPSLENSQKTGIDTRAYQDTGVTECSEAQEDIEYSHCFGKVTSGIKLLQHLTVPNGEPQEQELNTSESDVCLLHNIEDFQSRSSDPLEDDITIGGAANSPVITGDTELGITDTTSLFLGDVVEFNKVDAQETVLESVYHRFNTNQREHKFEESSTLSKFYWDEFMTDDYDADGFNIVTTSTTYEEGANLRPEGYYYKPHYQIPIRELSDIVSQDSLMTIPINTVRQDGNKALISCPRRHRLAVGDMLHVVVLDENGDDKEDYLVGVYTVTDEYNFSLEINSPSGGLIMGFSELAGGLVNGDIILRTSNPNIPDYAFSLKDGSGRYLWRAINRIGNIENSKLNEKDYPYTNDAFYYHKNVIFFLRRQDPKGEYGLYSSEVFPNDLPGESKPVNNYLYVNEEDSKC